MSTLDLSELIGETTNTEVNILTEMGNDSSSNKMMKLEQKTNVPKDIIDNSANNKKDEPEVKKEQIENQVIEKNENIQKQKNKPIKKNKSIIDGAISIYQYLMENKDKINNCKLINLNLSTVPVGKYMLFLSMHNENASLYKIDHANELGLIEPEEPVSINIYSSGIVIETKNQRIYCTKTNTFMYNINDKGIPTKLKTASKITKPYKDIDAEKKYSDIEMVKLILKKDTVTLYPIIKDINSLPEIINEILNFRKDKQDILYLLKIENILMNINI